MTAIWDKIILQQGDITDMDVDAIVNAANNDLKLGAGVAGAIRRKGGDQIQRECDAIGAIPIGSAAITSGERLKAHHVIHAASMQLGGNTTSQSLRGSTAFSLRIANQHKLRSIAFPAVGTGIAGFPMRECAEIMLEEAAKHLEGQSTVEKIYFVLFDNHSLSVFEEILKEMRSNRQTKA
ncbi:MAG TPA: macro domain-containing protein [Candidatus Acidoferrales bacterium]|nr:macro domain-containing protein [Candidatus Acidoferrales bacterium]